MWQKIKCWIGFHEIMADNDEAAEGHCVWCYKHFSRNKETADKAQGKSNLC